MGYTISVHHGGGKANRGHNIREGHAIKNQHHIDTTKPIEIWRDETEAQAYRRIFGKAQADYNNKQTRKERKIRSYHAEVERNAKMHTSYECIVEIGNMTNHLDEETERAILKQFYEEWEKRNPNMELYGAYFHLDEEGNNHLHLDYIPHAHGYKKGLEEQAGLTKALNEMGYYGNASCTAQTMWQESERQALEKICNEYGIEVDHPTRDGEREKREHLETEQYKATAQLEQTIQSVEENKQMAAELQGRIEDKQFKEQRLDRKLDKKEKQLSELEGSVKEAKELKKERKKHFWSKDEITIPYNEYQSLQKTARAVESVQKAQEALKQQEAELLRKEQQIQPKWDEIEREKRIVAKAKEQYTQKVIQEADRIANQRINDILERTPSNYVARMENFLDGYHIKEKSLLQIFQEKEKELKRSFSRGMDR